MTTRRGWWLVLEPALLTFTVVVCGGVLLFADSHASVLDRDHQRDTSGSNPSTATAASRDSFDDGDDDGDDDDDVGAALLAASIIQTSDGSHEGPRVVTDAPLSVRSVCLSSRGPPRDPPDGNLSSWTSGDSERRRHCDTSGSNRSTVNVASRDSFDDGDDDDDDDDDDGAALLAASIALTSDDSHDGPRVRTHVLFSLRSARLSSRGPPRSSPDRDLSSWTSGDAAPHRQNSSDDDIDDDDDDDDDDSSELGGSSPTSNLAQSRILIVSELDGPFSFASDLHSLRAPPQ